MHDFGLTVQHLEIIKEILEPYRSMIEEVAVFGSRSQGNYRDNSDIDLVIFGTILEVDVDRHYTLFEESNLPVKVDINAYHLITYLPLKKHIDDEKVTLFHKDDLLV